VLLLPQRKGGFLTRPLKIFIPALAIGFFFILQAQELRFIGDSKPKFIFEQREVYLARIRDSLNKELHSLPVDKNKIDELTEILYYRTLGYNIYKYRLYDVIDTLGTLDFTKTDLGTSDYFNNRLPKWKDNEVIEYITFRIEYNFIRRYFSAFELRDFRFTDVYKNMKKRVMKDSLSIDDYDNVLEKIQKIGFDPIHFYYKPNSIQEQQTADKFDLAKFNFKEMRDFITKYQSVLDSAERKYSVNKEIIVAILRKETNLGKVPLKYNPIEVLLGQALHSVENPASDVSKRINNLKRIARLQASAANSLYHIIRYCLENSLDPEKLQSNLVGALGFPQFMPFNLYLAVDGNGDGSADLSVMEDAIMSIGNFLNHNGWKKFISIEKKNKNQILKNILKYNTSDAYADAVYQIANKLKNTK
jgi:membrane-bound lytic murein transglycosylase B